jgi:hypothetical protein
MVQEGYKVMKVIEPDALKWHTARRIEALKPALANKLPATGDGVLPRAL